jgi:hypothetical protein
MNKIKIEVDLDQFNEWEQTEIMKEIFDNIDADRQEQFINNNISKASDRFIEDEYDDRDLGDDYFSDVDNIDEPRDTDYDKMTDDDRCNVLNSVLCSFNRSRSDVLPLPLSRAIGITGNEESAQKYFLDVKCIKGNAVCDYVSDQAYIKYHHVLIEDADWQDIVDDVKQMIEVGMKMNPRCKRPDFLSLVWDDVGIGTQHGLHVSRTAHDDTPALTIYSYKLKEL